MGVTQRLRTNAPEEELLVARPPRIVPPLLSHKCSLKSSYWSWLQRAESLRRQPLQSSNSPLPKVSGLRFQTHSLGFFHFSGTQLREGSRACSGPWL